MANRQRTGLYRTCSTLGKRERSAKVKTGGTVSKGGDVNEPTEDHGGLRLKYLFATLFGSALENAIESLRIAGQCNTELLTLEAIANMGELIAYKHGVARAVVVDELQNIDPTRLNCIEYKLFKLAADKKMILDTLIATYMELALKRNFQALLDLNNELTNRSKFRSAVRNEEAKNNVVRHQLKKELRMLHTRHTSAYYDVDVTIDELIKDVEDETWIGEVRNRYTVKWERSRSEQLYRSIRNTETTSLKNMRCQKRKVENEQRIHQDIMLLIDMHTQETLRKVEEIMNKYDKDIEKVELKIQLMKINYDDELDKRTKLQNKYAKHEKQIKEWLQFKEVRDSAVLYRQRQHQAAIVAQAWWRGIMVRLQLGPYNPRRMRGKKINIMY